MRKSDIAVSITEGSDARATATLSFERLNYFWKYSLILYISL